MWLVLRSEAELIIHLIHHRQHMKCCCQWETDTVDINVTADHRVTAVSVEQITTLNFKSEDDFSDMCLKYRNTAWL